MIGTGRSLSGGASASMVVLFASVIVACLGQAPFCESAVAQAGSVTQAGSEKQAGLESLELDTATGPHVLQVEVMRTEQEREKGLMFRRYLPKDRGMLFDFKKEEPVEMWMKNTYIPLDMVFIGHDGRVVGIAHDAEPLSETIIPSGAPAAGVLEVNAGAAAAVGLKVGDAVRHPLFKP